MSTDQDKSGKGGGDRPALFGPANDPLLADQIERLTGDALDSTIARLDAFSDRMFSDAPDEDPFPFGVEPDEAVDTTRNTGAHQPAIPMEDAEAADGLDRILDTLSAEPDVTPQPVTPQPVTSQPVTSQPVTSQPVTPTRQPRTGRGRDEACGVPEGSGETVRSR